MSDLARTLRDLEKAVANRNERIEKLEAENGRLRERIAEMEALAEMLRDRVNTLIQIEIDQTGREVLAAHL